MDRFPGSFHLAPLSYDPPNYIYAGFSPRFMKLVHKAMRKALSTGSICVVSLD